MFQFKKLVQLGHAFVYGDGQTISMIYNYMYLYRGPNNHSLKKKKKKRQRASYYLLYENQRRYFSFHVLRTSTSQDLLFCYFHSPLK